MSDQNDFDKILSNINNDRELKIVVRELYELLFVASEEHQKKWIIHKPLFNILKMIISDPSNKLGNYIEDSDESLIVVNIGKLNQKDLESIEYYSEYLNDLSML